jgi:hypothetical protein
MQHHPRSSPTSP